MSIEGGVHFDLVKRVLRDIDRSGQAPEEIIQQISDTVYPMYKAFIEPDLKTAHLKIYNTFNPFSGFMNPTYILKSARSVSKAAIKAVLQVCHCHCPVACLAACSKNLPGHTSGDCHGCCLTVCSYC